DALATTGYLSPALVSSLVAAREAMSGSLGGADPIACAQDLPLTVEASLTVAGETVAEVDMISDLIGHRWTLDLERVDGAWRIAGIDCQAGERTVVDAPLPLDTPDPNYTPAVTGPDTAPSGGRGNEPPEVKGLVPAREGWTLYHSLEYGYHLSYPADWTHQEYAARPGEPPLGPPELVLSVLIMPQAWADAMAALQGAPDPNAPVIAPYQLEVLRADEARLRALYPPATEEPWGLGGMPATRRVEAITDTLSQVRIVARSPQHPDFWLVFTDSISGFPDRLAGNEVIAATWAEIMDTVRLY
ncbi:MAG: hypothetical protein ACYCYF_05825, partial [Anaerolineae bacterium]